MIDETKNETERVGFCQDCGRPLTAETVRRVGSGVFCEPCLEVRLAGASASAATASAGAASQATASAGGAASGAANGWTAGAGGFSPFGAQYPPPNGIFPPVDGSTPHPVLAAFLGLIPGVGAMYNGQFAKGIAHIVIFALLDSMSHVSHLFGLLTFCWCIYQAIEAYHTAKARREGRPLPDPFNLNNIGEHLGFPTNWRGFAGTPVQPGSPMGSSAGSGTASGWTGYVPPTGPIVTPQPETVVPPTPQPQAWTSVPVPPPVSYYTQGGYGQSSYPQGGPVWSAPVEPPQADPPPPISGQWEEASATFAPGATIVPASRFPVTAAWLIGLGVLFLLLTLNSDRMSAARALPFFLAAFAVWIFTRRMSTSGGILPMAGEGPSYMARVVCKLRAPGLLLVTAVLLGLQGFDVVSFGRTFPILLIAFGALLFAERAVGRPTFMAPAPQVLTNVSPDDSQKGGR